MPDDYLSLSFRDFNYSRATDDLYNATGKEWTIPLMSLMQYGMENWLLPKLQNHIPNNTTSTPSTALSKTPVFQNQSLLQKDISPYEFFKMSPSSSLSLQTPLMNFNASPGSALTLNTDLKAPDLSFLGDKQMDFEIRDMANKDLKLDNTGGNTAASTAGGAVVGNAVGQGLNAIGSKIFGDSKAGQTMTTGISTIGSAVGSKMASNLMSGAGAFNGVGSMFKGSAGLNMAAGLVEAGFDVFDPIKKSGWEQGVDAALGVASNIPVIGPFATVAKLAFDLTGHLGGKKTLSFTADQELLASTNGSYNGSVSKINEAQSLANTKYSMWNGHGFSKALRKINEGKQQQYVIDDIIDYANDKFDIQQAMSAINNNRLMYNMSGGYNPSAIQFGRLGLKLSPEQARQVLNKPTTITPISDEEIIKYQEGGVIATEIIPISDEELVKYQEGGTIRTLDDLITYAKEKNPRFIQRMSEPYKSVLTKDGEEATHLLGWVTETDDNGNDYAVVYPSVMEDENGNLKIYDNAYEEARKRNDILVMSPEEAKLFTENNYKKGWPDFFLPKSYKEGGAFNVIPDGALHARKHNMETENITKKGIPVVDNYGEQQAEIEKEELIFRISVTEELERLYNIYNKEDASQKDKDEAALQAGKLLAKEIVHNTKDNASLMDKID